MATPDIDPETREMGLAATAATREAIQAEVRQVRETIKRSEQRLQQLAMDLRDCDAAERLFRNNSAHAHAGSAGGAASGNSLISGGGAARGSTSLLFNTNTISGGTTILSTVALDLQASHRIKDVVLDQLQKAGPGGTKAKFIRNYIEQTLKLNVHDKTVGMYLYRLMKDGKARRDGVRWFYVSETSPT